MKTIVPILVVAAACGCAGLRQDVPPAAPTLRPRPDIQRVLSASDGRPRRAFGSYVLRADKIEEWAGGRIAAIGSAAWGRLDEQGRQIAADRIIVTPNPAGNLTVAATGNAVSIGKLNGDEDLIHASAMSFVFKKTNLGDEEPSSLPPK